MAQANKPEASLGDAGIEADRLVVLAKPLPSGAGHYPPFAVLRFQDLPEDLRRQIAAAAARPRDARAPTWPRRRVAVPRRGLRRRRAGGTPPPAAARTGVVGAQRRTGRQIRLRRPQRVLRALHPTCRYKLSSSTCRAGAGRNRAIATCAANWALLMVAFSSVVAQGGGRDGKVVAAGLDASRLQELGDMEGSLLGMQEAFSHAWMEHPADEVWTRGAKYKVVANEYSNMAAGQRAVHAYTGAIDGNGLPARENAAPVVDNDGATEWGGAGGVCYYDVLAPPEHLLPAAGEPLRAVQVLVDAAAGGKAGDPIAAGVKAAGVDAGHEQSNVSGLLGVVVASSAATALAAGTVGPATAFGLFVALVGALSLAMASVRAR